MSVDGKGKGTSGNGRDEAGLTPAQRTWLEHMRQCEAQGLTYKAYCEREGLNVGGLYAARKKLRGGACAEALPAASPPRFAAVRVAHADGGTTVEVVLPNGVQLRVAVPDGDGLVRLVQELGQLAT